MVLTITGFNLETSERTRIPSSSSVTSTPISIILEIRGRLCSQTASLIRTSPLVMAAATIKVPASIRSCTTWCSAPCSLSTPLMVKVSVPAPLMLAPILFKRMAKSTISGSRAAFSMTVVPLARVAAIIRFWVAPTLGKSR